MSRPARASLAALAVAIALAPGARKVAQEERPAFWRVLERAAEKGGVEAQVAVVLEHLRGVPDARAGASGRLSRVDRMLREPWTPPEFAAELRTLLAAPLARDAEVAPLFDGIADWLDLGPAEDAALAELDASFARVASDELEGVALLEALSEHMGLAHRALDGALAGLAPDDWPLLFEEHAGFCEAWYRSHFPQAELAEEHARVLSRWTESLLVGAKVDRRRQLGVAAALARLGEASFVKGLARRLADARTEDAPAGALAAVGDEPHRRVLLYGRGSDAHGDERAALVVDLGGKDRYARAAVVDGPELLASVVIDLAGDDVHESAGPGPCYAAGGVALLVDAKGDDRYASRRLGQAAAALGCAILLDLDGDDRYELEDYGQGHALRGTALLYDFEGDDRYAAWAYAQGGGIGAGLSALVDGEGDDEYVADGAWPDVYGDSGPDVHHGAAQGYCTGLRPSVAGGIAALLDLGAGRDRYRAGSFAQGGGYYFSLGLMLDGGGDDESFGTRYAQGFGVHQAVGLRWDEGGDDLYRCRTVAHAGMAWDEGVGYLIDDQGDDAYETGALACGGAAQTGVAIFLEGGGADRYATGGQSQGGTGGSEYHEVPSIALHLDLGGDADERSLEERADGLLLTSEGVGLFVDSDARDAERALSSRLLRGARGRER